MVFDRTNRPPVTYGDYGVNIPQNYPHLGVDVSHYQEKVNWSYVSHMTIEEDSIEFVFIKATEGTEFRDERLEDNAKGADLEKMKYGFYHYYRTEMSAVQQADFFIEEISEYDYNLVPVLDLEVSGDLRNDELVDSATVFMNRVELKSGYRPLLYTYESFYKDYFEKSSLATENFWIANYNGKCDLMAKENFLVWQFSDKGTVNGIKSNVDLNIAKESFYDRCEIKKGVNE